MRHMKPLSEEVKEAILQRFELNPDGQLILKERHFARQRGWMEPGDVFEGTDLGNGYKRTSFKGRTLYLHRIVWFLAHGSDPYPKLIDHIDMDRSNNHPSNLRLCSQSQNKRNAGPSANNTTGYKGVFWQKSAKKWFVQVRHKGKQHYGGLFDTAEGANRAAITLREKLHGDFARHE